MARRCAEIERSYGKIDAGQPLDGRFDELKESVAAAIILSAASLEANINELSADLLDNPHRFSRYEIDNVQKEKYFGSSRKKEFVRYRTLCKYEKLSEILGNKISLQECQCKKNECQCKNARYTQFLVKIRNEFIHFKPERHDKLDIHWKLREKFEELREDFPEDFTRSPFFPEDVRTFPDIYVTHQLAAWSVNTVLNFSSWFAEQIDPERAKSEQTKSNSNESEEVESLDIYAIKDDQGRFRVD